MENRNFTYPELIKYEVDLAFIKEKRLALNYTQTELAYLLGYETPCTYHKYERGAYALKATHLPLLAQILQCEMQSFFKKA